jgi:hypothetical protein
MQTSSGAPIGVHVNSLQRKRMDVTVPFYMQRGKLALSISCTLLPPHSSWCSRCVLLHNKSIMDLCESTVTQVTQLHAPVAGSTICLVGGSGNNDLCRHVNFIKQKYSFRTDFLKTLLWSSGQSSGFDSRRHQIFWEVVGLERGPLSFMRIIEELFQENTGSGLENRD